MVENWFGFVNGCFIDGFMARYLVVRMVRYMIVGFRIEVEAHMS